jgi:hypothetical protein
MTLTNILYHQTRRAMPKIKGTACTRLLPTRSKSRSPAPVGSKLVSVTVVPEPGVSTVFVDVKVVEVVAVTVDVNVLIDVFVT